MYDTFFLTATLERAVKTFAQTLLATVGADSAGVLNATTLDAAKVAGGAALLSILTSFASSATGRSGPSLAGETTEADTHLVTSVVVAPPKKKPAVKKTTASTPVVSVSPTPVTPKAKPAAKKTTTAPIKKATPKPTAPIKKAPAKKTATATPAKKAPAKKTAPKKP